MPTDTYYGNRLILTHDTVTAADSDATDPAAGTQFQPSTGQSVLVWRASNESGTARLHLLVYSAAFGWCKDIDQFADIAAGATSGKFDTYGNAVALFVETKSDTGDLSVEAALTTGEVAGN